MRILYAATSDPRSWDSASSALSELCAAVGSSAAPDAAIHPTGSLAWWRTFRNASADLVHLLGADPLTLGSFLASGSRARLVIDCRWSAPNGPRRARVLRPLLEAGLRRAGAIVVESPAILDAPGSLAPWRCKSVAIPTGIDLHPFLRIRRDYFQSPKPPLVLAAGPLQRRDVLEHMVEAMEQVDGRLVIAGDGPLRTGLERRVAELGLEGRVRFAGRVSGDLLLKWIERADLFCAPDSGSLHPQAPLLAAMAGGLPVVSADRGINVHGQTGLVISPFGPAALASAINLLAGNAELRCRLGQAARSRAIEQFSRERMGRRLVDLYRRLLVAPLADAPSAVPVPTP